MNNVIPFTRPQPRDETPQQRDATPASPPDPTPAEPPTPAESATPISRAVYTVTEVAELLSLSTGSTYTLIRSGDIPARKLGGRWVIPKRRFHNWLDQLPEATTDDVRRELDRLDHTDRRHRAT